ncbi:methyltransferase, partial [Candidatus Woesearchaeota archaeon]|nr:methyltransferase [Candidatus Woesearchaeota archaeon]
MPLYEPQEDSELLRRFVVEYASGEVLDMGAGSGILALAAAEKEDVKNVLAVDIDDESLVHLKKEVKNGKVTILKSDLFANITTNDTFDTIIFNPPYLPQDPDDKHQALYGGAEGYELTVRFLEEAKTHLTSGGIILLLFSSLT